jgi:glycosyltransferase involved in cell wall biosynthesis
MSTLSLLISSYNQLEFLRTALTSVVEQTRPFDEIIVVDDGSTDGSPEFLREWVKAGKNRHVTCLPQNQGLGAVRDAGLLLVTSDYVVVMDGDDWLEPDVVVQTHNVLDTEQPDIIVFQAKLYLQDEDRYLDRMFGNKLYTDDVFHLGRLKTVEDKVAYFRVIPPLWNKVHRMGFLREHAITTHFKIYEDIFWLHQCGVFAKEIRGVDKQMITYRIHSGSVLRSQSKEHLVLLDVMDACEEFMSSTPAAAGLRKASHRYQFDLMANMVLNSPRLPDPLRPGFAAQILGRSYLFDFQMEEFEIEFLERLRALAQVDAPH